MPASRLASASVSAPNASRKPGIRTRNRGIGSALVGASSARRCIFVVLIVVLALVDTFGRPAGLQVNEIIFGSLLGALLPILGVEGAARLVKR